MTFQKVAQMLAEYKNIDVSEVKLESTFADLKLDSLDVAEMVMDLEDAFGVSIDLDEQVHSVAELVQRIEGGREA